jgi:hypothetical protein
MKRSQFPAKTEGGAGGAPAAHDNICMMSPNYMQDWRKKYVETVFWVPIDPNLCQKIKNMRKQTHFEEDFEKIKRVTKQTQFIGFA